MKTNQDVTITNGSGQTLAVFWPPTGSRVEISGGGDTPLVVAPTWNDLEPVTFPTGATATWREANRKIVHFP